MHRREQAHDRADVGGGLIEHEVVDIFVGEMPKGIEPVMNLDEVMDTIWRPLNGLAEDVLQSPDVFTPWLKIYLREYSDLIFADS